MQTKRAENLDFIKFSALFRRIDSPSEILRITGLEPVKKSRKIHVFITYFISRDKFHDKIIHLHIHSILIAFSLFHHFLSGRLPSGSCSRH